MKNNIIKSIVVAVTASLCVNLLRSGRRASPFKVILGAVAAFVANMLLYSVLDKADAEEESDDL